VNSLLQGERRLAALMFTDIVGYTSLTQRNEALSIELLEEHQKIVRSHLSKNQGREIKTIGDAFLVEFASALDAASCAFEIQKYLHKSNLNRPTEQRILLRIGIHLGDVIHNQNDVYGDAVNIASRIEAFAQPGGVCLTAPVYDQIKNKFAYPMSSLGKQNLKNVTDNIEIYKVVLPWERDSVTEVSSNSLERHRVAVLPFTSLSPDPNDEFFADGLTEELIARLSLLKDLEVIARTSIMNYKKKEKNANQIGRELRAGTLIEGSVRRAGNRIRVTAQLIDSKTESHLWAESYDRNLEDIFTVQSELAERVATSLHLKLTDLDRKKIDRRETANVDAHVEYLKGKVISQRLDKNSLESAIVHFETAIRLDPKFVLAYCDLAGVYSMLGFQDIMDAHEAYENAERFAKKALALDDSLPEAHLALAFSHVTNFDFASRERDFKNAIKLNPNLTEAHEGLSSVYAFTGRWEESLQEVEESIRLNPLSVRTLGNGGTWYLYSGQSDRAIELFSAALELDPGNSFVLDNLGLAHIREGMIDQGLDEVKKAMEKSESFAFHGDLAYAYVKAQRPEEARKLLAILENPVSGKPFPYTRIAAVYAVLGEKEKAIDYLEKAYEKRSGYLPSIATDFVYENLRGEPRFEALLKAIGLRG
jgi:adenylate cyclase